MHNLFVSSGAGLSAGLPDRGKDRERRGSLQLLPSRPALRTGTAISDPTCNGFGHNRCYKPSLTVEEVRSSIIWQRYCIICVHAFVQFYDFVMCIYTYQYQPILDFSGSSGDPLDLFLKVSSLLVMEVHTIDWQSVKESEAL